MRSQAHLSLEASLSFPNADPSCDFLPSSSAASPVLASTPSLYVTFKALCLVRQFREKVKTRVQAARYRKKTAPRTVAAAEGFCQEFERQAFEEIDRYLGRKTSNPYYSKRKALAEEPSTRTGKAFKEKEPSKRIEWLLDHLDKAVKADELSLTSIAADNKLFLRRTSEFTFSPERLSLKELTELVVTVIDLLHTLRSTLPSRGAKTLSEGNEVLDRAINETYIANLEHLLLCLKDQLLRLLIAKLVELVHRHVIECQRDHLKHSEDWFFEFPDARHPLSTTWPWSIRPSLAVLWGVCWMFYEHDQNLRLDENFNMVNEHGQIVFSAADVEQFLYYSQNLTTQPGPENPSHPAMLAHTHGQQQQPSADPSAPRTGHVMPAPLHSPGGQIRRPNVPAATQPLQGVITTSAGVAIHDQNTYPISAAPSFYVASPAHHAADASINWLGSLPEENSSSTSLALWPASEQPYVQPHLPQPRNRAAPEIRVNTYVDELQPQDSVYHSATSVSSHSSIPYADVYNPPQVYNSHHLSPQSHPNFPMTSTSDLRENMQTPPRSPHDVVEQSSRKRSHSEMISQSEMVPEAQGQPPQSAGSHRSGSVTSMPPPQSPGEDYSPRNRAFKRPDPPMNHENKYYCDYSPECGGLTFDRKCEWSKHMDKHDRPYRCPHPSCAKLQGFTYSGGLLRHEREVHGKHGGPKAQLMCPYDDCKRHNGKGFTRKENLNEHIRRVHNKDQPPTGSLKREAAEALAGAEAETPASQASDAIPGEQIPPETFKRRRLTAEMSERSASEDVEDMKNELKRLREENAEKDARLRQIEEQDARRQADMQALQETVRQLQQQGPVQQQQ